MIELIGPLALPLAILDDLGPLAQTGLAIVTLAAMAGFGLQRGHTKNLESRLTEERTQVDRLSGRVADLEKSDAEKTTEIANLRSLKTNEAVLTNVATELVEMNQKVADFGDKLDAHNGAAETHWQNTEGLLGALITATKDAHGTD